MKKGIASVLLVLLLFVSIFSVPVLADTEGIDPQTDVYAGSEEDIGSRQSIEEASVTLETDTFVYTGSSILPVPAVIVKDSEGAETELDADTQFAVMYRDESGEVVAEPVTPGSYTLEVKGKGDYTGTAAQTVSFTIEAFPISEATVTGVTDKDYTGQALTQTPAVRMTAGDTAVTLQEGTDYTLSYSNNTNAGTATMTFTGIGNCTGTKEITFTIRGGTRNKGWHRLNGAWYYYAKANQMLKNGWAQDSHGWCYMGSDGRMLKKDWAKDSKGWCWLSGTGYWDKKSHWINDDGEWYFLKKNCRMAANTWLKDSHGWCYAGSNGKLVRNGWAKDTKGWRRLGSSGRILRKTWIQDGGEWYYLKKDGYMASRTWLKDSHGWCYANANGKMRISAWAKDSKGWQWLDANGYYNPGCWHQDKTGWFYVDGTGTTIRNKWMRDSKGWCWVDQDGYYDDTRRYYQNPSGMIQISTHITNRGLGYYVSPLQVSIGSDRSDHIEAMIDRAYDYLGDPFVVCQSRAPGKGVDCSGIVMQACYAAGIDLWPSNPKRHLSPAYEYESREIWKLKTLETVAWKNRKRGDLIFYANSSGTVIHIAIYLGNDKIIHSWPGGVRVSSVYGWGDHIKGVKRIFH